MIAAWEGRLLPLARVAGPVAPPASLWGRIGASAGLEPRRAEPGVLERAWRSVVVWRCASGVGFALAAALAAFAWLGGPPPVRPVAALVPYGSADAAYVAQVQADGSLRLVALRTVSVASGKDLELWALPKGATKPVALGVVPAQGSSVPVERPGPGTQLLISLEPAGGSPTGLPTGPVLYAGTLGGG